VTLTITDLFCGAGGSSSGAELVPGVRVRMAANHWALAVETHNRNLPHADHDTADISQADPRRYPRTDILWASPECVNHSQAKGRRRTDRQPDLFGDVLPDAAAERSRATMFDVLRFAEHHRYRAIVVENVVDVRDWILWPAWVTGLDNLGYDHEVVYLNSMHAQAAGPPAPQSRDRLYVVAWRRGQRAPDLTRWTRPPAWCPRCNAVVAPVKAWKNPARRHGRYRQQYLYRCPALACRGGEVYPGVLPAAVAIDWALAGERIGDRARPLAPKTLARIEAGLRRYARPIHLEAAGNTFERRPGVRAWPVDEPLRTVHTTPSKALACPPFLAPLRSGRPRTSRLEEPLATVVADGSNHALVVPVEGRDGLAPRTVGEPLRTQTARLQDALVVPLRNNGVARPADQAPAPTVAAGGNHHALVMRNNSGGAEMCTPVGEPIRTITTAGHQSLIGLGQALLMRNMTARGDQGQMSYPPSEPMRTVLAEQRQSLVRWDHVLYGYDTGELRSIAAPAPTQTTIQGDALLGPDIAVDDCTFRMLEPHEIQAAMAFDAAYIVLGNKRERVRQLGNAVTPPAARDLIAAVVEALTGEAVA
jgi:DNA (cytosine-5)-methyltransferase 1